MHYFNVKSSEPEDIIRRNGTNDDLDNYDEIYNIKIASVPFWYYSLVSIFLGTLGVGGILLNGFLIWCFMFFPIVSIFIRY